MLAGRVEIALPPLERRQLPQQLCVQLRANLAPAGQLERLAEPRASLGEMSADEPEVGDSRGEPQAQIEIH